MSRWFVSLALMAACSGGPSASPDATPDNFDRSALLQHLAHEVLLPIQAAAAEKAAALPAAITAYCDALDAGQPGTTLEVARTAWADSIDAWQRAEAVLVGPAAEGMGAVRNQIYGWPNFSSCGVDTATAARWADPSYDITAKPFNYRTLTALEYLLYTTTTAHNCFAAPPGWDALGADLARARCRLAVAIASDVAVQTAAVHTAWRTDGGDYAGELTRAGSEGSPFASAHAGVNAIAVTFLFIDRTVKDMKLGEPAGIVMNNACGAVQEPCLEEVELSLSDRATFAIRANLRSLREAFTGTRGTMEGPGFDDFLRAVGHPEVADRMLASLDTAIDRASALPDSYLAALANNYDEVVATHAAVKSFSDDLKSQFLTVLAIDLPDEVPVDND